MLEDRLAGQFAAEALVPPLWVHTERAVRPATEIGIQPVALSLKAISRSRYFLLGADQSRCAAGCVIIDHRSGLGRAHWILHSILVL
ncbi:hypothetical protein AWC00_05635 [Mycobacterium conspicuum]|nr:hypothetical protein AWC00_05635 [Mycobacterium conspicuum]